MNIADILKDCPQGTRLYSTLHGEVFFQYVEDYYAATYPIAVKTSMGNIVSFAANGTFYAQYSGECLLFPSKENRNWSTFKPAKKYEFKPFDKVLVRDTKSSKWKIDLFSRINENPGAFRYVCMVTAWNQCIPYEGNEHLLGTTDNPE